MLRYMKWIPRDRALSLHWCACEHAISNNFHDPYSDKVAKFLLSKKDIQNIEASPVAQEIREMILLRTFYTDKILQATKSNPKLNRHSEQHRPLMI